MTNEILLLLRTACAAGIVLLMAGNAKADLVLNFEGANAQEVVNLNVGTLATIVEPGDGDVVTSLVYTVSDLTIDTDGVLNDTVTFTIPVSATGAGANINWDDNNDGVREFDYNGGALNAADEGITFGAITVSGTGSGGLGYQLNSAVYNEFTIRRFGTSGGIPDSLSVTGDVTTTTLTHAGAAGPGPNVALNDSFFTAVYLAGNGINPTDVDFTVDVSSVSAIPEPTSLTMFGLGLVGLIARRRRA